MIAADVNVIEKAPAQPIAAAKTAPHIGLEQYYREAGPDYAAWSREFNMHFGYYRAGANPLRREAMLEQMNAEVLARLEEQRHCHLKPLGPRLRPGRDAPQLCPRPIARQRCRQLRRVPWQVEARPRPEPSCRMRRARPRDGGRLRS